ncbi:hypothetical protein GCM10011575_37030 [Microlunatus endophyticus]|uniref:Pyrrolo-quinoline quinone repeat domain-containing protein n=1 Tax=Microlunatus endophyticus TaxID=1716077 RepID=A0A917W832_9ACTN|nr:PQQ-binding-like beta-propeller repeat protein [Microlunatus endophyticus]GGL75420.1 hypothetical protein GCM10011575_37030 [Microlunatus endophyticus]
MAARVAVRVSHRRSAQLFSASHQLIGGLTGIPLAVGGDLVVSVDDTGAQCRFFGFRGTEEVFRSPAFDCAAVTLNGSYLMLAERMYFQARGHPAGGWQLDLRNGKLRRTGPVAANLADLRSRSDLIYASDDVLARQTGKTITGLDPDTRNRLWSYTAAGDDLPEVSVANGAVMMLTALPRRAAVLSGIDPESGPELMTVLDGRTGKVTGRRVITAGHRIPDGIWSEYGIGAGRALIMMNSGDVFAIGAHS